MHRAGFQTQPNPHTMKIIFSHGKESGPWGTKIRRLGDIARNRNLEVDSIDYTDLMDPEARVERLLDVVAGETEDCLLAGSSMGGYVALVAGGRTPNRGVFLMAPVLYMPGFASQDYSPNTSLVHIVHGWNDDIIPVDNSIRFARETGSQLHLLNGNHALSDALDQVDQCFAIFLNQALYKQHA